MQLTTNKSIFTIFLLIFFMANLFLNYQMELSFDEAYYWIYSEYLAWGYFDHPPMVAFFIKAGTLIFGDTEVGVRIFFNLAMCLSLYLIYILAGKKNTLTVILLSLSMPLLYFAGMFALPDTPLLLFSLLFFYFLKRYLKESSLLNTVLLALAIAGMFYSKYHGLLIVLLTVAAYPKFLKQKMFWLCALFVTVLYLPHVWWQYSHEFISFKFHLTGRNERHFELANILNYITGQIVLMGLTLTPLFILRAKRVNRADPFERIMLFNSFGFLFFLFILSFRNQIEANWSVSCGAALIILFASKLKNQKLLISLSVLPILLGIVAKGSLLFSERLALGLDIPDNRFHEISFWKSRRIPLIREICEDKPIVAETYQVAAKLSFYLGEKVPAIHLNSRSSQFDLLRLSDDIPPEGKICFLSSHPRQISVRIETMFKDPIYVVRETSLKELKLIYGENK